MPTSDTKEPYVSNAYIREMTDRRVGCAIREHTGQLNESDLSIQVEGALLDLRQAYEDKLTRLRAEVEALRELVQKGVDVAHAAQQWLPKGDAMFERSYDQIMRNAGNALDAFLSSCKEWGTTPSER